MKYLEQDCERLIDYLGDQINEDSVQFIKNTFSNLQKEIVGNSIYPQFKRVGDCEISEGGLSKLDYFAAKSLQIMPYDSLENFSCETIAKQVYDIAEAMVMNQTRGNHNEY